MVQRGQRELSQNLARKICTRIYSLRDVTLQLKKRRASDTFPTTEDGTHCLLFQVFLFFFL